MSAVSSATYTYTEFGLRAEYQTMNRVYGTALHYDHLERGFDIAARHPVEYARRRTSA
jgi:hypothetical protein